MEKRFKLWTRWNRGTCFATLAEAQRAANAVQTRTGIILLITEEKPRKRRKARNA